MVENPWVSLSKPGGTIADARWMNAKVGWKRVVTLNALGGDEGAVPPRGWGKAVVGIGSDDGNGLVGLHVDETGDR